MTKTLIHVDLGCGTSGVKATANSVAAGSSEGAAGGVEEHSNLMSSTTSQALGNCSVVQGDGATAINSGEATVDNTNGAATEANSAATEGVTEPVDDMATVMTGLFGSGYRGPQSYRDISHTHQRGRDREVWRCFFFYDTSHALLITADKIPLSQSVEEWNV